jgi:hypothetical protein
LAKCTAITQGGERCKGVAIDGSGLCYSHHPDHAQARQQAARKGGKRGGRGRPSTQLAAIKSEIHALINSVLVGRIDRATSAVVFQGYNVLLRAHSTELAAKEQEELMERLSRLEAKAPPFPAPSQGHEKGR